MGLNKTLVLILSLSCLIIHTIAAVQDPSAARAIRRGAWRRRVGSPQIMVLNLCRNTTNSPLCVKTILPSIKAPFNQFKALEAEMLAAKDVTLKTKGRIQNLLLNPMNSKDLSESLNICEEQFGNILNSIKEALVSVQARDPLESRMKFSAVISNLESCRDLFKKGVNPSPIGRESSLLSDLGANCLDISKKIEDQQLMRVMKRFGGKLPPPPPSVYSSKNDPCFGVIGICNNY